jgi:imidazoleglycerol-phosphate dehydratase
MTVKRTAEIKRKTRETDIGVAVNLDGTGVSDIKTGVGFLDHMLELLARHSLIDLSIHAEGDLHVDYHHTVEDVGLVLGSALNKALGERRGIRRYGFFLLPMDEALAEVAVDLGGRPYLIMQTPMKHMMIRDFEVKLIEEFFRALSIEGRMNIHLRQISGDEPHHLCEAFFKGFARALRAAVESDARENGVPSSKGMLI